MTNWINFAEIRARVSLEDVLFRFYRLTTLKRESDKVSGPCPVHGGDSPRAFHADLSKNIWHCFSQCKKGGNQLDFVALKEGISIRDAALKLQAFFPGTGDSANSTPPPVISPAPVATAPAKSAPAAPTKKEASDDGNPPLTVKLDVKSDHPHLLQDRGLQHATTAAFGVGYVSRGIMRGTIAIPIHDEEGTLVAYAGRRLKPVDIREYGKYKLPTGFKKELVLYNLHRAKAHAESGLILVEGFFSVLKLTEAGFPNVVACLGSELSERQARLLADIPEVIILFDGNEAGWKGAEIARERLRVYPTIVRLVRLPAGLEPEDLSPKALRWLVNGARALKLAMVSFTFESAASPTLSQQIVKSP